MSIFKKEGIYDPAALYALTNITDDDFSSRWNNQEVTIKSGQTVELPEYLAAKFSKDLIDKIMQGNAVIGGVKTEKNTLMGIEANRDVWENKIVKRLEVDEESTQMQLLRIKVIDEIKADVKKAEEEPKDVSTVLQSEEFAGLLEETQEPVKRGRPAKK